jgi:hypothetical protein
MSLNIRTPDPNQAKVFDVADPDRHGKIIARGPQVSQVKFNDGVVRVVSNVHLRQVEALPVVDNGFSQLNPSPGSELLRLGQQWHASAVPGTTGSQLQRQYRLAAPR